MAIFSSFDIGGCFPGRAQGDDVTLRRPYDKLNYFFYSASIINRKIRSNAVIIATPVRGVVP